MIGTDNSAARRRRRRRRRRVRGTGEIVKNHESQMITNGIQAFGIIVQAHSAPSLLAFTSRKILFRL